MPVVGFIGGLGATELGLILLIVLILFGAGRLPQVFEAFGKGLKSFREAQKDGSIDVSDSSSKASLTDKGEPLTEDAEELKRHA